MKANFIFFLALVLLLGACKEDKDNTPTPTEETPQNKGGEITITDVWQTTFDSAVYVKNEVAGMPEMQEVLLVMLGEYANFAWLGGQEVMLLPGSETERTEGVYFQLSLPKNGEEEPDLSGTYTFSESPEAGEKRIQLGIFVSYQDPEGEYMEGDVSYLLTPNESFTRFDGLEITRQADGAYTILMTGQGEGMGNDLPEFAEYSLSWEGAITAF